MSLKRTAMKMAVAFAAAKGYRAYRDNGGLDGVKRLLSGGGTGPTAGRSGGLMGALQGTSGSGGGLAGLIGALAGGGAASGGLMGGLASMTGASQEADDTARMARVEAGPQDEATAAAMVRAIGQAVRADGHIDAEERSALDEILGEAETEADRAALDAALSEPVNPERLARDVPRNHESEVYAAALTAIDPDHPAERDFLRRFATALALEPAEVSRLHDAAGKPV
ncbi:Inner membrane protein YebE [Jannaschia seosinensis]|uniref:Inner membrane protein YebE n=1 Tax=Jannaschia seosinensis TaxID=313367 RepID=A0A0M7BEM1_9RHOB|nr:DUF533 domain-containing protein [Jannaschia seosinensis]CUH40841.1 Inner membrane protein YebE [Jannaschia seosinensis]